MNEELFKRTLENKCPICNESLDQDGEETVVEKYNEAKLKIHKKHIKYKR